MCGVFAWSWLDVVDFLVVVKFSFLCAVLDTGLWLF